MSLKFKCNGEDHYLATLSDLGLAAPLVYFPWESDDDNTLPSQASDTDVAGFENEDGTIITLSPDGVYYLWTPTGWDVIPDPTPTAVLSSSLIVADDASATDIVAIIEETTFEEGVNVVTVTTEEGNLVGVFDIASQTWISGPLEPGVVIHATEIAHLITLATAGLVNAPLWTSGSYGPLAIVNHNGVSYQNASDSSTTATPPAGDWSVVTINTLFQQLLSIAHTEAVDASACSLKVPAWSAGDYLENQAVCFEGTFYIAGSDTDASPPDAPWTAATSAEVIAVWTPIPPIAEPVTYPLSRTFNYTGSDQNFVIPDDVKWLKITCDSAKTNGDSGRYIRGGRAVASFDLQDPAVADVINGTLKIMRGANGGAGTGTSTCAYGFGGIGRGHGTNWNSAGNGLQGVFLGSGGIAPSSRSRALVIACGAGGFCSAPVSSSATGCIASSAATMAGGNATATNNGGGGAGYGGGNKGSGSHAGYAGSCFVHPLKATGSTGVTSNSAHASSIKIEWTL